MDKEEFKDKYINKHTKEPFIYVSESWKRVGSFDYEKKYKNL